MQRTKRLRIVFPPSILRPSLSVNLRRSVVFAKESGASLSWHVTAVEGSVLGAVDAVAKPGQIVVRFVEMAVFLVAMGMSKLAVARLKPLGRGGAGGHARKVSLSHHADATNSRRKAEPGGSPCGFWAMTDPGGCHLLSDGH